MIVFVLQNQTKQKKFYKSSIQCSQGLKGLGLLLMGREGLGCNRHSVDIGVVILSPMRFEAWVIIRLHVSINKAKVL